jgi:hypothetical protein
VEGDGEKKTRTITRIYANIPDSKYGVFMLYTDGKSEISLKSKSTKPREVPLGDESVSIVYDSLAAIACYADFLVAGGVDGAWKDELPFENSEGAATPTITNNLATIIIRQACIL